MQRPHCWTRAGRTRPGHVGPGPPAADARAGPAPLGTCRESPRQPPSSGGGPRGPLAAPSPGEPGPPVLAPCRLRPEGPALTAQCTTHTFLGSCRSQACMLLQRPYRRWRSGARRAAQPHSKTCGAGPGSRGLRTHAPPPRALAPAPLPRDVCSSGDECLEPARSTHGAGRDGVCVPKLPFPGGPRGPRRAAARRRSADPTRPTDRPPTAAPVRAPGKAGSQAPAPPRCRPVPEGVLRGRGAATHPAVEPGRPVRPGGQVVDGIASGVLGVQKQPHVFYVVFNGRLHAFCRERHHCKRQPTSAARSGDPCGVRAGCPAPGWVAGHAQALCLRPARVADRRSGS